MGMVAQAIRKKTTLFNGGDEKNPLELEVSARRKLEQKKEGSAKKVVVLRKKKGPITIREPRKKSDY